MTTACPTTTPSEGDDRAYAARSVVRGLMFVLAAAASIGAGMAGCQARSDDVSRYPGEMGMYDARDLMLILEIPYKDADEKKVTEALRQQHRGVKVVKIHGHVAHVHATSGAHEAIKERIKRARAEHERETGPINTGDDPSTN